MGKWKYFTDEETEGMQADTCFKLDRAREFYGFQINLTCGYRDPEHNARVGGKPDSAHLAGKAADMKAPSDPFMREKLAWALGAAGFKRVESAPKHFHADTDDSKPTPCFWQGDDH